MSQIGEAATEAAQEAAQEAKWALRGRLNRPPNAILDHPKALKSTQARLFERPQRDPPRLRWRGTLGTRVSAQVSARVSG